MTQPIIVNRSMNAREWALLLILALLWGCTFFFISIALKHIPPLTLVFLRVGIAAAALHIVAHFAGIRLPTDRGSWLLFTGLSLVNNIIPFSLINWGQSHIASGVAAILNGTTPIFTVIAAHYFTHDERMTGARVIGVLSGLGGIAVMVGGDALHTLGLNVAGQIAIVGAAMSYTIAALYGRRVGQRGIAPLAATTGMLTVSSILTLILSLAVDRPWQLNLPGGTAILAVLGLSLPSTALAYLIFFRLLATAGPTNLMLVTFLIPVTAIGLGVGIIGEQLEPRHFIGIVLIAIGLAAIDGRLWRLVRRPNAAPE